MPLEKLIEFTEKVSDLADKPNATMSAAEVKAKFDAAPDEVRVYLNRLIDKLQSNAEGDSGADNIGVTSIEGLAGDSVQELLEALKTFADTKANSNDVYSKNVLQATTDGASGADQIKATPIASSPNTVQGILEWLKTQIDTTALGQIPDGSLTDVKLSDAEGNIKQALVSHLADGVSHITAAERTNWNAKETPDGARKKVEQTDYKVFKSGKDANGIFTTIEYKRQDDTLAVKAVLSGGTSPNYTTRTITYYGLNGTTVEKTSPRTLAYDADGVLISEV